MRHTEEITVTIKGLAGKAETFVVSRHTGKELLQFIALQRRDEGRVAAAKLLPELSDDRTRPAAVLRGLRMREKLTQKALAELLGMRQHHLSEMEHGKRTIGKAMAKKLAAALNTDWRLLV